MAFIGNRHGPRKSDVVARLGPSYFGISRDELEVEIELYKDDEFRGQVDPVYVDADGRLFLEFNAVGGETQRFYLDECGYSLEGEVATQQIRE